MEGGGGNHVFQNTSRQISFRREKPPSLYNPLITTIVNFKPEPPHTSHHHPPSLPLDERKCVSMCDYTFSLYMFQYLYICSMQAKWCSLSCEALTPHPFFIPIFLCFISKPLSVHLLPFLEPLFHCKYIKFQS
ncbi:hypothetical protein HanRHA438_Chr07g0309331 [Helianthus annuus]|nr:hypothetical protein HanRHA438_Chr07g0309331 [Helianthus annuus]